MAGANGAPAPEPAPPTGETVHTQPPEPGPEEKKPRRSRRSPASKGSAAAKSRKKKKLKVTEEDLVCVGEIVKIAFNGGDDPIEPDALVETWRMRVQAWDKVHGKVD